MKSTCSGWSAGGRKRLPLPLLHHQEARLTEVPKIKLPRLRGLAVTLSLLVAVAGQQLCLGQAVGPTPTSPAATGESQNLSAWFQYIALELKKIRLELIEERCEKHQTRLSDLERELQRIHNQQRDLEEEQKAEVTEPHQIDAQLAQPGLSKEQREELEARKAEVLATGPSRFARAQAALSQRETQAREHIAIQQHRIQLLANQAQDLAPTAK